jgi:hypothetical protein
MLANDDVTAAVFGIVGVIVGAIITSGVSVYLVRERDKKDARAARRIFQSELEEAAHAIGYAFDGKKWPPGWTKKAWSESWSTYRPTLAVAMEDDKGFGSLAEAYLFMELLETALAAGERPFVDDDEEFLKDASEAMKKAKEAL